MRLLRLHAAVAAALLAGSASAGDIELEVRGARATPTATAAYGAHRCIPFVSCRFEWNLLGGPSRFELERWHPRIDVRRDGDAWRLRVNPRPWTLGAYALETVAVEVGEGARVYVNFGGERASSGDEAKVVHYLDEQWSPNEVGPAEGLRRVVVEVRSRPTLGSFMEGVFLATAGEDAWAWDAARARFTHGSGATVTAAGEENGFVTLALPAGARVDLPVRWEGFWMRDQKPADMAVAVVAVEERAMRDVDVSVLDVRTRAYAFAASRVSPVDRTLVMDASSWAALRSLPPAPGVEVDVVSWPDGTPKALAALARRGAPVAVVCIGAWHGSPGPLGPACARVEVR